MENRMTAQLNATFAALADPTRRAILTRLATGERTVGELAAPFDMSLPAISKHLKVLEKARLISRGRQGQWRPCRLRAAGFKDAADWLAEYRRFWEGSFDRLARFVADIQTTGGTQRGRH
jgi:DNA-binding transcriptional ArsR family regulator